MRLEQQWAKARQKKSKLAHVKAAMANKVAGQDNRAGSVYPKAKSPSVA